MRMGTGMRMGVDISWGRHEDGNLNWVVGTGKGLRIVTGHKDWRGTCTGMGMVMGMGLAIGMDMCWGLAGIGPGVGLEKGMVLREDVRLGIGIGLG